MSVPKYDHSAVYQDLVPDTPCGTVSASVAEKEFCSCACLGDQLSSAGWTTACGSEMWFPSENTGKWTQPTRTGQVSQLLPSGQLDALPSISIFYSDLFNINPKVCRNPVAPVEVLYQMPQLPVQGAGHETTPSCVISEIHGARGPFLSQENKEKFSKQLKHVSLLPNLCYPGLPSSLTGLRDVNPSDFIILKLGRLIRGP